MVVVVVAVVVVVVVVVVSRTDGQSSIKGADGALLTLRVTCSFGPRRVARGAGEDGSALRGRIHHGMHANGALQSSMMAGYQGMLVSIVQPTERETKEEFNESVKGQPRVAKAPPDESVGCHVVVVATLPIYS